MANNPKKYAGDGTLSALVAKIKELFATKSDVNAELAKKANSSHTHTISNVTNLQTTLDGKVPTSRTVNGKALTSNITLSASDVGAATSSHTHDDRYYTESEVDTKLSGKANSTHTHDDRYYTETEIDTKLANKSDTTHNHDTKYDAKGSSATVQENLNTVSDTLNDHTSNKDIHFTTTERTKLSGIAAGAQVNTITGVKGGSESTYRTGNVNITKANIGLGNVDNTADANKSVNYATSAGSATSATKATQDGNGKVISSTYETKTDASAKLTEAKTYADNAANTVKNDLLNGAGGAYDTLKELGDLIDDNTDAIDALESVAAGKANAVHTHAISDVTNLQSTLDAKASSTYLKDNYITNTRIKDELTSTASNYVLSAKQGTILKGQIDSLSTTVSGKADASHTHTVANITDLTATATELNYMDGVTSNVQAQLDSKANSTHNHAATDITSGTLSSNRLPTVPITKGGTGATTAAAAISNLGITATAAELNYVDGVTSNIQTQLNSKQDKITGAASTIVSDNLTTNRVLISDSDGKVSASSISGGELSRLSGATKNIQDQIDTLDEVVDSKVSKYGDTMTGNLTIEPTSTTSPLISLIGNANASGKKAKTVFRKSANSSIDYGTEVSDETFDGRKTSLVLQSNNELDKNRLRLKLTASDGTYEEYNLYGEHYKPTAADLGALENSSYDLHSFVTDRNVMYASNIVGDDVIPFIDVSLRSGRKITMNEFLEFIADNAGLASVSPITTAEYTALEKAEATNANTLYMLTDSEDEAVLYTKQNLTEEQKSQARANIGVEETIMDMLITLNLAPAITDDSGAILAESDGSILLNL